MILNSDVTAPQTLGTPSGVSFIDKMMDLKDKALAWKPSTNTFAVIVGASVILIVERKIRYKPKTFKMNFGGK